MASTNCPDELNVSEHDHMAMRSTDDEERNRARTAWLARRHDVLVEWERRLMGKRFIDTEDKTDEPEV